MAVAGKIERGISTHEVRHMVVELIDHMTFAIGGIGVFVIVWGAVLGLYRFVELELRRLKKTNITCDREKLRHHLGSYLLLGLEFLVAADVIRTILRPSLKEVAVLGS